MFKKENVSKVVKTTVLVVLGSVGLIFTSCKLDSDSNFTPAIMQGAYFKNHQGDTLRLKSLNSEIVLDTIRVGDTVSFSFALNGYVNNLVGFRVNQSADSISRIVLPSKLKLDSIFTSESNYSKGIFIFKNKITFCNFPFKYVAKKTSMTGKFSLTLSSDANFGSTIAASNTVNVDIKTPIKSALILY